MNHIRRISRLVHFLVVLVGAMLGLAVLAPAAFAMRVRASGGSPTGALTDPRSAVTHSVVASGMTGWQITLVVTLVAVLAATIAIIMDRARAATHRTGTVPAS